MGLFDNTQTSVGIPWGPIQQPTLSGVDYISSLLSQGPYQGAYAAPINPYQQTGIDVGASAALGAGGLAGTLQGYGAGLAPGLTSAYNYYQGALGGPSADPWLRNTGQYMNLAGQFATNPYMDQAITAALRDPYRELTERTLPGIRTASNLAGGAGGSQEAVMAALAGRGYQDRAADIAAQMRLSGLNTGYGIANQAATGDRLLAQNAANNLASLGGTGLGLLGQGYDITQQGAQDRLNWGTQLQNLQNQQLQAGMQQYYAPWDLAKSYGSYINPLAGSLKEQTVNQDLLSTYLLTGLAPILGSAGSAAGGWLFGTPTEEGHLGDVLGQIGDWVKGWGDPDAWLG